MRTGRNDYINSPALAPTEKAPVDESAIARREAGLHKDLSRAQVVMIGLGGAIGTGLFMGSGMAIGYAGPAVIVSFAIALPVRMPFFPGLQIAGLVLLAAVLITMGLDKEVWRMSWIVGVPWLLLISAGYFIWKARRNSSSANAPGLTNAAAVSAGKTDDV
jgi:L-asparagine transporter-like permease